MPLLVFWLTPVVLLIIFLLVIFANQPSRKAKIFVVEPLLFLVGRWQLARYEGQENYLQRLFSYWLPGLELQQSTIEQLFRQITPIRPILAPKNLTIIHQQNLPFWGELRTVEIDGKKTTVIAGAVSEIINYCDADADGRLTPEKRVAWPGRADLANRHGFLTIALAESSAPDALLRKKFKLTGLLVLEPVINPHAEAKLRQAEGLGSLRYLSVLNADLVEQLVQKVFPIERFKKVSGETLATIEPKEQERLASEGEIFGEMATKNRYWIIRHLQRRYSVSVISNLPTDNDLPSDG